MSWSVDSTHTTVDFSVRHLGLATVKGVFHRVSGELEVDEQDITRSTGRAEVEVASIDTRDEKRDAHLRSADFFDVEKFPTITFVTRAIRPRSGGTYEVEGDLTIRGVTRPVTLTAELSEAITDPWGLRRSAVSVEGEIDRTAFGLTWNQVLDAGRLLVGEKVKFHAEAELVQAAAVAA